jgi:hypothetical protein
MRAGKLPLLDLIMNDQGAPASSRQASKMLALQLGGRNDRFTGQILYETRKG